MLVVTQRVGGQIAIGDAICVTVVAIKGESVRLGITAPKEIPVDRLEIHKRRMSQPPCSGEEAASSGRIVISDEAQAHEPQ